MIAICPCGVDEQILIGGGMMNHETTCLFPCSCEKCHSLVETNILAKRPRCPKCRASNPIPYSDPRLVGDEGRGKVESWGELALTDGTYKCPKCKKTTLRFEPGGMLWD